jgi:hypothetical protein
VSRRSAAIPLLVGLAGCDLITDSFVTNDFSGDLHPIEVDSTSGAVLVGLRADGAPDRVAALDLLSPVTLVDPGADVSPSVTPQDLLVLGERATGELDLPRARLRNVQLVNLHPCDEPECTVGPDGAPRVIQGVIGADSLAGDAVRLRLGDDRVFVLPDIAGTEVERAAACDAVFNSPYRGGGTLVVGGTELGFSGRRITMQSCLGFAPGSGLPQTQRGADALLLVSTGVGTTLLGASAYERYRRLDPATPALETLPTATVHLASGPISGRATTISNLALVGRAGTPARSACRHVYAHHLLLATDCFPEIDCPCDDGDTFCPVPAMVEIAPPAGVPVLVIADEDPTLQALRAELRPDQPEVDGILGTDALRSVELDIDYPHARVLGRCTAATCSARPALPDRDDRDAVAACIGVSP